MLRKVRDLLSDRNKWTTGALAKDEFGRNVHPHHKDAVMFCASGALERVTHEEHMADASPYVGRTRGLVYRSVGSMAEAILANALTHTAGNSSIPSVNDGPSGYDRIMAGLAKAIGVSPKRHAAALKGWDTRRKNEFDRKHQEWLRAREAASVDPRPEVMVIGGTVSVPPTAERKGVAV
jgi:hypothetical protein